MKKLSTFRWAVAAALVAIGSASMAHAADPPATERWWSHVKVLADDGMEGRLAGTPGYDRAAAYVADRFAAHGLKPAGTQGYLQSVAFAVQRVFPDRSSVTLTTAGVSTPLVLGDDLVLTARIAQPANLPDAPLVFIGYGLHMPEVGHDDFAGVDLRGKVAVVLSGGPSNVSASLRAHAARERWEPLEKAGAVGLISIQNPKQVEIPWARSKLRATEPAMRLADPALNPVKGEFFTAAMNPAQAGKLFAASGRTLEDLLVLADAGKALPGFALNQSVKATVARETTSAVSPNVVALLPGSDPVLSNEYVVLTAHLDGLGVGAAIDGDAINNGAMDNASGVASLIEQAAALKTGTPPKRSILFVAVTAEEQGLLGSQYFAERPTVTKSAIVANVNMDMFMPSRPATNIIVMGEEESTLGPVARRAAASQGFTVMPDPAPNQLSFVRSDQYSFIRTGVPALAGRLAHPVGSPEAAADRQWRAERYHGPKDDLSQPFDLPTAVRFNAYMATLISEIANTPERPQWLPNSFFRRFSTGK
ncbi:M28 family metallopeptidase [Caulobacter sp. BE264]|uniref:M28 family metallopeptidase n=1 Tax=Caulobacter sp. BE264 TaxID=2817724 RepID=UPI00286A2343|nr:M28 family metallopeptidase [Caulobacter sp. BE264]